jgi:hypothetical protein
MEYNFGNCLITFDNPQEILGMGGPWIGDLYLNRVKVTSNIILNNIVYNPTNNMILVVKYNSVSKWANKNFFSILGISLNNGNIIYYKQQFDAVFIKRIFNTDEIEISHAFHDEGKVEKIELTPKNS